MSYELAKGLKPGDEFTITSGLTLTVTEVSDFYDTDGHRGEGRLIHFDSDKLSYDRYEYRPRRSAGEMAITCIKMLNLAHIQAGDCVGLESHPPEGWSGRAIVRRAVPHGKNLTTLLMDGLCTRGNSLDDPNAQFSITLSIESGNNILSLDGWTSQPSVTSVMRDGMTVWSGVMEPSCEPLNVDLNVASIAAFATSDPYAVFDVVNLAPGGLTYLPSAGDVSKIQHVPHTIPAVEDGVYKTDINPNMLWEVEYIDDNADDVIAREPTHDERWEALQDVIGKFSG